MIFVLLFFNFAISWFNAWTCGKAWIETKAAGGLAHFMNWMGAVMSAAGFTWCYLVVLAVVGAVVPVDSAEDGSTITLLTATQADALINLGYVVVIGPILGSGLAITLDSWAYFYRQRTIGAGIGAGYNTFAQVYNTYNAVSLLPDVLGDLGGFFDSKDGKGKGGAIVILLVVLSLIGGILTTSAIIRSTARRHAENLRADECWRRAS